MPRRSVPGAFILGETVHTHSKPEQRETAGRLLSPSRIGLSRCLPELISALNLGRSCPESHFEWIHVGPRSSAFQAVEGPHKGLGLESASDDPVRTPDISTASFGSCDTPLNVSFGYS